MGKKKKKRARRRLSREELARRRADRKYKSDIRTVFVNAQFEHIPTRDVEIEVGGMRGDLDSVFVHENVLVVVEDTTLNRQSDIGDHLRKKCEFFNCLRHNKREFIATVKRVFPRFRGYLRRHQGYNWNDFKIIFLYCSRNNVDRRYQNRFRQTCRFCNYGALQYFLRLAKTIHASCRFELLKYLGCSLAELRFASSSSEVRTYEGLLLPEGPSGFPEGHKLVSFLVDPNMLLEQSYVLRAEGWQDTECLYQRLLLKKKIENMREFLAGQRRVYVNNIISTLPPDTRLYSRDGQAVPSTQSSTIAPVIIEIPRRFDTIGIIDGQHRVFSYHEGGDRHDRRISILREKQHLLVTGIIYPPDMSPTKKTKFEAELFLEINDKQSPVKGDLKQAIQLLVNPYSAIAIAKGVIAKLAETGPLCNMLEVHFYDVGKIKTTSIVSYGMRHIVGIDGEHSFFRVWRGRNKTRIRQRREVYDNYVTYCVSELNKLISAFKAGLPDGMWTQDKKVSRALTTTTVNGLIFCMRKLIENRKLSSFDAYRRAFSNKIDIDFRPEYFEYKSSHWKDLGEKLYEDCFA